MKKSILLIAILIITSSCAFNGVALNVGHGVDSSLGDIGQTNEKTNYSINDISVEFIKDYTKWSTSVELCIVDHKYEYEDKNMLDHSTTYSVKGWLIRNFKFDLINVFAGVGVGIGYINPTKNNRYIADTHVVSDLGIRAGIQKNFENFGVRLEYMLRHFSGIGEDDRGENEDEIRAGIVIPF